MKRLLPCLILVLCCLVGCVTAGETPIPSTTTQPTEATTEATTTELTTVADIVPDANDTYYMYHYYDMIRERRDEEHCEGLLTDIDNDGLFELAFLYTTVEDEMLCDLYTVGDDAVIPLLEKHPVYYNKAGGATGFIGVTENDGSRYFAVRSTCADWKNGCRESIGAWELYTLNDGVLSLETEISFDYLHAGEDDEGIWIMDKPDYIEIEIIPEESSFTVNGESVTAEQYALWLDNTVCMEAIDGYTIDSEQNSLKYLQAYCSLELFMHKSNDPDELWYQWHNFMGISDSAAWTEREWVETNEGVRMELGVLHENSMNRTGAWEATLAEKIAAQYAYWEETGELDYFHTDKTTPPLYQVTTLAINARSICAEVQIFINGEDFGTYAPDHCVLILPVASEAIVADKPATVELKLRNGTLPDEADVFICMSSNISGAR